MKELPHCIACASKYIYEDRGMYICPECGKEWSVETSVEEAMTKEEVDLNNITDANGNVLKDGDTVSVIKDLKVKGSSWVVKVGTKVKGIRLVEGDHDIDCKVDGIGAIKLRSCFVKKVS